MDVHQYEDELNNLDLAQEGYKLEILRIQRKFLYAMCNHNQLWAKNTDNPEVASIHLQAAELIQKTVAQYDEFLKKHHLDNRGV